MKHVEYSLLYIGPYGKNSTKTERGRDGGDLGLTY